MKVKGINMHKFNTILCRISLIPTGPMAVPNFSMQQPRLEGTRLGGEKKDNFIGSSFSFQSLPRSCTL